MSWFTMHECTGACSIGKTWISNPSWCQIIESLLWFGVVFSIYLLIKIPYWIQKYRNKKDAQTA